MEGKFRLLFESDRIATDYPVEMGFLNPAGFKSPGERQAVVPMPSPAVVYAYVCDDCAFCLVFFLLGLADQAIQA